MRELSDEEVFGSTKELSDADVFGPAKSGGGIMDAVLNLFRGGKTPSPGFQLPPVQDPMGVNRPAQAAPAFESVLNDAQPDPSKFNFKEASIIRRMLDDNQERRNQYGTIGPIVGPEVSAGSVAKGLLTDLVAGGKGARAGISQMAGDLTGSQYQLDKAKKERGQADLMSAVNTPEIESATGRGIYGGLSSLVRNAPSLALAVATRSPAVALGGMAAPMLPEEYGKFRQRGGTPLESLAGAAGNTATEVATELLPMGFLVKQFGRAGAGQFLTGLLAREVPGEQVATLVQDAIDTAVANPDKTWGDYIKERPGAAYQTLIATLTQGGIMGAGNAAVNRLSQPAEKPTPTLADYQDAAAKVFGAARQPAQQAVPQDAISRVLGQSAPAQDQAAVADRIIAAITGESQQPAVELTDAEVFGDVSTNSQEIDTSAQRAQNPLEIKQIAQLVESQARIDAPQTDLQSSTAPQVITTENGNGTQTEPSQSQIITAQPADGPLINEGTRPDVALTNEGKTAPMRLGVDNVPMADGGKPFKTKLAASKAKKLQPMMRVIKVDGGFALADKTPAQLAAEAKAAKRIRGMSTGNNAPMSVHEFIAAEGGLSRSVQSDLGIERNVKIGNRWLYAGPGKGMTIEQAAEKLKEAGYIDDELHNTAYDIIRRSINNPQYTAEGWERVAEAQQEAQFEDYLAAEQEAPADDNWTILTPEELEETGYNRYNEQTQAEIRALVAQAEAMGIDADSIMEDVFYATQNATQQDYENAAKAALQTALQGSNGSSRQDSGQAGAEESRTEEAQPEEGLTSYTPQEIEDRLAKLEQAEQERKQQDREAEQRAQADAQRDDFTLTGSNRDADVAAARGQRDIFSAAEDTAPDAQEETTDAAPAQETERATPAPRKQATASKIEDFGEKIGGARKDVWTSFKDQLDDVADDDIANQPLSKIWPQPDYQALLDGSADPWTVAFAHAARDEIPTKPRQSWKLKRWSEQVRLLRDTTKKLMDGSLNVERAKQLMTQFTSQGLRDVAGRVELYMLVGHRQSLDGVRLSSGEYSIHNGIEYKPAKVIWSVQKDAAATAFSNWPRQLATGFTKEEALQAFKAKYDSLDINPAARKEVTFDIYSKRGQDGYFIGKKMGRNYIDLAGPFENVKLAREHKATKQAELVATLEKAKEIPRERRDTNEPRIGEDMRNGEDVTPQMFGETFGFRGVEFGNWVEQGRRQKDLNDAFDALMDMAAVLGIPPKAISLNGELGLAFGARGGGGVNPAAAHYEPGKVVINLTKKSGAGSLGHEWWHALDNYFSRMRSKGDGMMTDALDVSLAARGSNFVHQGAVRKEMVQAFGAVMKAIRETAIKARSSKLDAKRTKEYWTTDPEMSARAFESYLISKLQDQDASNDYLANIVDPETWKAAEAIGFELDDSYPYPTAGEIPAIRAGFDHFFQTVETRETDKGVMLFDIPQLQDAGPINRLPDAARANVLAKLKALEKRITDGKISETEYRSSVQALIEQIEQRNETRLVRSVVKGRERGPDWITERLIRAKRKGELDPETVDFALWALAKNPALAEDLGISVRESNEAGTAGDYNPISRIMRLFKGSANTATAVHEILHHTERMMPTAVQNGILKEYGRAWDKAWKDGDEKVRGLLQDMLAASAGDNKARGRVLQAFRDGALKYDQHYQLFNASEFWAVNATDIMAKRYGAQGSWIAQAKRWLTEMVQYVKGALGLRSDAPILRGLESVLNGTGKRITKDMLVGRDDMLEDINANGIQSATNSGKSNRDAMGRVKFRLGEVALGKLDAVTRPLQERFGMRMASPELRRQLRTMKATIDQANRSAANVAQQMKDMPEADRAMVSDIVEKMIAPGVVPPEHAVRVSDAITKTMDRQTDELVALGMLSQDSADRWRGRYLPRIYNRKTELGEDTAMDAVKNMFKTGRPTMQGIGGGSLKGRGLFQDVSVDAVDQWLGMGYEVRDPHWKLNQGKLELVDKNAPQAAKDQVTVWRDWTPSERAQMGENRDALFRYVQGYTNMQRDIALGRLFNQIANNPDFVRRSASEGWVKVPDTEIPDTGGVKRYGNLAGLYVRQDVMSHLSRFEESANEALQLWRDALGLWKEGKTALNPVAHFNNIASNISMAHFAGVSYWDGHKYVGAARDLVNDVPMVEEAREAGLFTGSFTKEELMQNMPPELQKMMQMEDSKLQKAGRQVMNALTFWLRKPLQNAYEFEDTYFKYLIYRDARQQGLSPEDATDYALKYIFTYDDLPSGARKVRDFAIPFFSWTYKALPALLHTAMVYPWRFLAPAAMLNGINLMAYALAAGDDDDDWLEKMAKGRELEKEEREALPERSRGTGMLLNPKTIRLGTDSVTGNPVFLDASRVVPGGDMFDMENQAGGLPIPAPLMPNHPVLSAFSAMIANKEMFMGREVVDKNDTGLEAAEKRAKWMAGFMLPAVAPGGYHSQRILDATANAMDTVIKTPLGEFTGVDRSGLPVQPKYAAMQTLGVKARPVDLELEASRRKAQEAALVRSIAAEVRSMGRLYQRGAVSDDMMERTRESAREKIDRVRDKE